MLISRLNRTLQLVPVNGPDGQPGRVDICATTTTANLHLTGIDDNNTIDDLCKGRQRPTGQQENVRRDGGKGCEVDVWEREWEWLFLFGFRFRLWGREDWVEAGHMRRVKSKDRWSVCDLETLCALFFSPPLRQNMPYGSCNDVLWRPSAHTTTFDSNHYLFATQIPQYIHATSPEHDATDGKESWIR